MAEEDERRMVDDDERRMVDDDERRMVERRKQLQQINISCMLIDKQLEDATDDEQLDEQ